MPLFLQGFTIGLAYVAPIGLQNLFVINTALTQKKSRVYLTALIVTFFDVTLALACFFGIGAIMSAFEWLQMIVLGAGSLIVMWIGIGLLRAKDSMDTSTKVDIPILKVISSACVVTWFNGCQFIILCVVFQHLYNLSSVQRQIQRQSASHYQYHLRRNHRILRCKTIHQFCADGCVITLKERVPLVTRRLALFIAF